MKYSARLYQPMPTERWGVWKKQSRCFLLIALVPDRRGAKKLAEKIAAAMNAAE